MRFRQLLPLFGALFALYIIWGSTYFVIRIGVESWPPLMMAGVRFLAAGILLLAFLLLRGHKLPPLRPLLNAALIGLLLLAVGMMAGAIEMLAAGVVLMIASMIAGEKLTALPSLSGFLAVGYLALFGSIIAINAYMYLIRNVSPALATSYAYVNPVVAVLLGTGLGGETLSKIEWLALGVIVFAVVLVTLGKYLFPAKPVVAPVIQDASSE